MKLYVESLYTGNKIYIEYLVANREELANLIGSKMFIIDGEQFHVNQVFAESNGSNGIAGAIVGGLIGLIGGPIGLIGGAVAGGALGSNSDVSEVRKVERFNKSQI